jgi:hemerythrin
MALEWSAELSVGVADMDEQHKKLINMINDLNAAMRAGKGKETIGTTLGGLVEYTQTHFTNEEKILDTHGYPALTAQRMEHRNFIKKISDFKKNLESGSIMISMDVMNFLYDWLKNHIMKTDKGYTSFLNGKGVR